MNHSRGNPSLVAGICAWVALLSLACPPPASAGAASPEQAKFFEEQVRPLLADNCLSCHGEKKQKGGLRLDSAEAVMKGGKNGPVLVPGKPEESKLIVAVGYKDADLQMPPDDALPPDKAAVLARWVKDGAPWPAGKPMAGAKAGHGKHRIITDEDRTFWSFRPLQDAAPPAVEDGGWGRNEIDRFVFAKLKAEGLTPAPQADRAALIRRVTFDLHGLPPTPAEVAAFVADASPDAYEKLIDRLLASPRYGEHWARHWLDLVRYGESDGYRQDAYRTNAWPYRDYVIRAFNDDKPYDRFVTEQLAGDELAGDDPNVIVATGYLRNGLYEYNQRNVRQQWDEILNDEADTTGDVFLGLSMGCARCHDHKFDPILQSDYYRLRAFFAPMLPRNDLPLATANQRADHAAAVAAWEKKTENLRQQIELIEKPLREKLIRGAIEIFPPDIKDMIDKPADQRSPLERQLVELAYRQVIEKSESTIKATGPDKVKLEALHKQLAEFEESRPKALPVGLLATDVGPAAPPMSIPGAPEPTAPGFPVVLDGLHLACPPMTPTATSTGRRTALARWITNPANPLTTRVIANRIWQYHFGRGLVSTSSDYGKLGEKPSHPELLDWLARRFVADGWSFKRMHRLILTSAAYRQSALRPTPDIARTRDPENRWLWRANSRRLDAEQVRDAMLAASGELTLDAGGPSADATAPRRSIYCKVIRNTRDPVLDAFDAPDAFGSLPSRNVTTTANQALLMINGQWPLQRAAAFAARLAKLDSADRSAMIDAAYRTAYGRAPDAFELRLAAAFLSRPADHPTTGPAVAATNAGAESAGPPTQPMPHTGNQAVLVRNADPGDMLCLADNPSLPAGDFTVEAVVLLESIYENAAVRVIASQWDGNQAHPGWSLGVTSEKSKHKPRNLILQLVGENGGYEVIPSDLFLDLHKAYYVAVSVRLADRSEAGVTFYVKDLSDNDAPLRAAGAKHNTVGSYRSNVPLVIGGRSGQQGQQVQTVHGWDGLIDEVRVARAALGKEQLFFNGGHPKDVIVADWQFEEQPGLLRDSTGLQPELAPLAAGHSPKSSAAREARPPTVKVDSALVDFCHVLLNSNEFLYVD